MDALRLDWASYAAMRAACLRWHYSRRVPTPPQVRVGVWEHERFVGVVVFSRGSTRNLGKPYGLTQQQCCELTRVALDSHETPTSRIVAIALKMLRRSNPGLRLVVSFADPNVGHLGTLYQAGGWLYFGRTPSGREYIDGVGRRWHERQISVSGRVVQYGTQRNALRPDECRVVELAGKHRYLMPLDRAMSRQLLPFAQPYPRAGSAAGGTRDVLSRGGGSIPTPALHA